MALAALLPSEHYSYPGFRILRIRCMVKGSGMANLTGESSIRIEIAYQPLTPVLNVNMWARQYGLHLFPMAVATTAGYSLGRLLTRIRKRKHQQCRRARQER